MIMKTLVYTFIGILILGFAMGFAIRIDDNTLMSNPPSIQTYPNGVSEQEHIEHLQCDAATRKNRNNPTKENALNEYFYCDAP